MSKPKKLQGPHPSPKKIARQGPKSLKMTPKSEISKSQKTKNLTKRKLSVYKSKAQKTFLTPSQPQT